MQRRGVHVQYGIGSADLAGAELENPLFDLLVAVEQHGSIRLAAKALGLSYRHVWGQLKAWESDLGEPLVDWLQGKPAHLTPFAERLLGAERRARTRMAPHLAALRAELQHVLAQALDTRPLVLAVRVQGPRDLPALAALAELAATRHELHLVAPADAPVDDAAPAVLLEALASGLAGAVLMSSVPAPDPHRFATLPGPTPQRQWVALRRHADAPAWLRLQDTLASPHWARVREGLAR